MKIPENQKPYRVIINGVEKVYEAGAEVEVDAATAAIIKNADAFPPAPATPVPPIVIPEPSGGGGDGALIVNIMWDDHTTMTLDKTWQEMFDADEVVIFEKYYTPPLEKNYYLVAYVGPGEGGAFVVGAYHAGEDGLTPVIFSTDSADGYPSATSE